MKFYGKYGGGKIGKSILILYPKRNNNKTLVIKNTSLKVFGKTFVNA
jgi:hypothetical protein